MLESILDNIASGSCAYEMKRMNKQCEKVNVILNGVVSYTNFGSCLLVCHRSKLQLVIQ